MKIDGIDPTKRGGEVQKKTTEAVKGESFDSILKSSMGEKPAAPQKVSGPLPVVPLHSVAGTGTVFQAEALKQMEAALDDLELYRSTLAQQDVPLGRLQPMTDALMARKDSLVALLPHVDDPEVKDLISETAAVIINENSRFHAV